MSNRRNVFRNSLAWGAGVIAGDRPSDAERGAAIAQHWPGGQNVKVIADRYSLEILPRARKAYELMLQRYGLTLASFTSVLNLQRMLFRLEVDYIAALERLHAGFRARDLGKGRNDWTDIPIL
jgi:hypothetical protein